MNHGYIAIGLFTASLAASLPAVAMSEQAFQTRAAEVFKPLMAKYDVPGLAVGVTWKGKHHVYTQGMADRAAAIPVSSDTLFELGSMSKTFNATLAALAQERSLLSLDDRVAAHIPELDRRPFGALSLMDLASHQSSGLPLQPPDEARDDASLMTWLKQWEPVAGIGHERSYSNVSIGMLGRISARAFGQPYAQALHDNVLQPLTLEDTYVEVPATQMKRYAYGYAREDNTATRVNPGMLDAEAYGLKSNIDDMLRFVDINLGAVALPEQLSAAIATTHQGITRTSEFTQAMVWERYPWPVSRERLLAGNAPAFALDSQPASRLSARDTSEHGVLFGKTGSTNGFGGYIAFIPDEDIGLVFLANRNVPLEARVDASFTLLQQMLADQ
ncbi:class C beta-lactamase [Pseudomonas daroniae]|uniref:Beta-lactamase n=1 Tax=Phytopseudomonas daroniae TaxID=2487519 RepID=A0A4Q9QLK2_9GAMM|nr:MULTISPECIES: class C beta-lactamase [Pseudomonas]TBU77969.1 class C beta-lactamase [Pseudomonas daroniae]TBU82317.1 class C beta-lactamase [Pseudomonas sp. FRB 228]TBU91056.1 class C beta-lactamase [Pseudomonas daroniae]